MVIDGISINLEEIRCELERRFFPTFGMPLDIATMITPLDAPQDGDPRIVAPPPEFIDIYNAQLLGAQWDRLIALVREPVKEIRSSQGFRAVQVLSQTVLLFLPNGLLHAWVWDSNRERGMHLRRLPHDSVALSGHYFETDWLLRLAELAVLEIRTHVCFDEGRACAYGAWTFELFGKVLAEHADISWMRQRTRHSLALGAEVTELAQQTISPLGMQGSVTVAQHNHVRRQLIALMDVCRESPQLIGFYEAMCTHRDFPQDGEPVQRLKRFLKTRGLTLRGWSMVLSLTVDDLAPLYDTYAGDLQSAVLDYVLLLDALGLQGARPTWLIRAILRGNGPMPIVNGALKAQFAVHGYLSFAGHVVRLYLDGSDAPSVDNLQELKLVMEWLSTLRQPLARSQKQGGWTLLLKKARAWEEAEVLRVQSQYEHWSIPFLTLHAAPLTLRGISNARDLGLEGKIMRHCVGSYVSRCAAGESLIFSVLQAGKHIATAEYRRGAQNWFLHSARGPRNSTLAPTIQLALRNAALNIGLLKPEPNLLNQPGEKHENNDHAIR
jgi:hypothetical protein